MRSSSLMQYLTLTLFAILALWYVPVAEAVPAGRAVVGIDYGSTNVRMGMLRSGVGSVEIVLSFESDRKTINAVAYRDESVLFSQTAMNMFPKFPKAIFCQFGKLLGKFFNSPSVKEYRQTYIHEIAEDPVRKTVLITEPVQGKLVPVEEIAATFFTHLMDQAEIHAGFKVADCIISVPAYFDHFERQAVLDSAKIAGFNVISLINSVSAAALFKTTTANNLIEASNFIIYDSGAGGTSAALVTIDPKKTIDGVTAKSMEILGLESDPGLGGDLIDERIASFLISKFESSNPGVKVTSGKPRNKVLIEAARIKKILNANDRVTASLEDLVEDYGMSASITREDTDSLIPDLAPRFIAPIEKLLSKSNLSLDKISAILLIGGNTRHQFLLKSLKGAFGPEKLSVTLDPDEAIVKGATLYSAKLHPAFRLRPTHFMDITPSGLYVQYREIMDGTHEEGELKTVELFPEISPLQSRKSLTLKKMNSVLVDLFYSRDNRKIASISVNGFKETVEKAAIEGKQQRLISSKMKIPVFLSSSGHVVLETPVAVVEYEETVSKKVFKTHTKTPTATPTPTTTSDSTATTTTTEKAAPTAETSVETQTVEEKVKRSKNLNLSHKFTFEIPAMTLDEIRQSQETIGAAREKEFEKTRIANARNDLEKAVYRIQGDLASIDFMTYSSNSERSTVKNHLSKISKFLADEPNEKIPAETYLSYTKDLVKIEDSINFRKTEEQERPVFIEKLQGALTVANEFVQTQRAIEKALRPQSDEDLGSLTKKIQEITKWLQEKTKKQANSAKSIDPVLLIADLELKGQELFDLVTELKAKKMPIIEAKPVVLSEEESPIEEAPSTPTETETVTPTATATQTPNPTNPTTDSSNQIPDEGLIEERFEL